MAKTPATTTPAAPKAAKPAAEAAAPKTEAPAAESTSIGESTSSGEAAAPAKRGAAPSRPISYFSSVSTDEYRAGWSDIFGKANGKGARKSAPAERDGRLPVTLELDIDSLDAAFRENLETMFRQQAKKKRLNYDGLIKNNRATFNISCRISE